MTFEQKLVKLRKQCGMSQEELADNLNVSRQAVSRWELGTAMPDAPNLLAISNIFKVSTDYLLHDEFDSDEDIPKVIETKKENLRNCKGIVKLLLAGFVLWLTAAVCNLVNVVMYFLNENVPLCVLFFVLMCVDLALAVSVFCKIQQKS